MKKSQETSRKELKNSKLESKKLGQYFFLYGIFNHFLLCQKV